MYKWKKNSPLRKGWYFFRQRVGEEIIVSVDGKRNVCIANQPNPHSGRTSTITIPAYLLPGEWAGPIPEPHEPKELSKA